MHKDRLTMQHIVWSSEFTLPQRNEKNHEIKCREGLRMLLLLYAIIPCLHRCMNCNSSLCRVTS